MLASVSETWLPQSQLGVSKEYVDGGKALAGVCYVCVRARECVRRACVRACVRAWRREQAALRSVNWLHKRSGLFRVRVRVPMHVRVRVRVCVRVLVVCVCVRWITCGA